MKFGDEVMWASEVKLTFTSRYEPEIVVDSLRYVKGTIDCHAIKTTI
jgi:hypothetical protein